ncbi:hypothetical protein D3C75_1247520 [compost metagenome]
MRVLAKEVKLVDQYDGGLFPTDSVLISGHYLQRGAGLAVRDRPNVVLHMQQCRKLFVVFDHVARRRVCVVRHLYRRRKNDELG